MRGEGKLEQVQNKGHALCYSRQIHELDSCTRTRAGQDTEAWGRGIF